MGSPINISFVHHFSYATPNEWILEAIMLKQPVVGYSEVRDLFVFLLFVYHSYPDQFIDLSRACWWVKTVFPNTLALHKLTDKKKSVVKTENQRWFQLSVAK